MVGELETRLGACDRCAIIDGSAGTPHTLDDMNDSVSAR